MKKTCFSLIALLLFSNSTFAMECKVLRTRNHLEVIPSINKERGCPTSVSVPYEYGEYVLYISYRSKTECKYFHNDFEMNRIEAACKK